jgi:hypothetical protein
MLTSRGGSGREGSRTAPARGRENGVLPCPEEGDTGLQGNGHPAFKCDDIEKNRRLPRHEYEKKHCNSRIHFG